MGTHQCGTGKHVKSRECRKCYNKYMRAYLAERYQKRRNMCLDMLGNKCAECGSAENLQFDRVKREEKVETIASMLIGSLKKLLAELEKCQLLCYVCHLEKTGMEVGVPHGGGMKGKRNCKCLPCILKRREYARDLRRRSVGV